MRHSVGALALLISGAAHAWSPTDEQQNTIRQATNWVAENVAYLMHCGERHRGPDSDRYGEGAERLTTAVARAWKDRGVSVSDEDFARKVDSYFSGVTSRIEWSRAECNGFVDSIPTTVNSLRREMGLKPEQPPPAAAANKGAGFPLSADAYRQRYIESGLPSDLTCGQRALLRELESSQREAIRR